MFKGFLFLPKSYDPKAFRHTQWNTHKETTKHSNTQGQLRNHKETLTQSMCLVLLVDVVKVFQWFWCVWLMLLSVSMIWVILVGFVKCSVFHYCFICFCCLCIEMFHCCLMCSPCFYCFPMCLAKILVPKQFAINNENMKHHEHAMETQGTHIKQTRKP